MIELVVLDMAGTTVNDGNAVSNSFRAALAAVGVAVDHTAVTKVMGLHKPEAIRRLLVASGQSPDPHRIETIHADFVKRMQRYYAEDPAVREVPGAAAAFAEMRKAGTKVALNTGFSRAIVDVILDRLQWKRLIDASVASDEVSRGRPYPDMIRHLMSQLGVSDVGMVAKVGDTPVDLEEGTQAGCGLVIGVTTGSFTREQLQACPHTHIVDSVCAVPEVLTRENTAPGLL